MRLLGSIFLLFISIIGTAQNIDSLEQAAQGRDQAAIKANNLLYNNYINNLTPKGSIFVKWILPFGI